MISIWDSSNTCHIDPEIELKLIVYVKRSWFELWFIDSDVDSEVSIERLREFFEDLLKQDDNVLFLWTMIFFLSRNDFN